ncbi:hypothetical protein [Luteibacter sp. CQ10]|uniref:hypothetical protein n=1 Tax=Luteibacter sp. CQ10 TaxID=2805821 RepID=UPI0034A56D5D
MLHIDHASHIGWTLSSGDCRIGRYRGTREADWLTPVHCAATLYGETFTREHLNHPDHRAVTRIVSARRYAPQSSGPFHAADGDWILATDGYWTRDISGHESDAAPDDDCSALILMERSLERRVDSDVENFLDVSAA